MDVLALILARGGSKGIPRKNLVPFLGRPLLDWSIISVHQSQLVTRTILSTDDEEIARAAADMGCEVPFMRPAPLAADDTPDHPVFVHALEWLAAHEDYRPDLIVHVRPTTPLRPPGLIDKGIAMMMEDPDADSLRSVCIPDNNPFKMWQIGGKYMTPLVNIEKFESFNQPRQSLPEVFWQTGMVDITRSRTIFEFGGMSGQKILPLIVDRALVVDIDDEDSLRRAEKKCLEHGMEPAA